MQFLVRGIRHGFQIGFNQSKAHLRGSGSNMLSAKEHREVVWNYLDEEVRTRRVGNKQKRHPGCNLNGSNKFMSNLNKWSGRPT